MASAYYTVSESDAILVTLLAKERKVIYRRKGDARQHTLTEWQLLWQNKAKRQVGCTAHRQIDPWLNQTHGKIDYFLIREMLKSVGSWSRVVHYVRTLLIAKKIELDRGGGSGWQGVH